MQYEDTKIQGWTLALQIYSVTGNWQSLPYKNTKIESWRLALQTYSVLEVGKLKCTIRRYINWRYKLTVSLQFTKSTVKKQKNKGGGRWRYKLTVSSKFAKSTM